MIPRWLSAFLALVAVRAAGEPDVTRIWLTHQSTAPDRIVVNWHTDQPGGSVVDYGPTEQLDARAEAPGTGMLHHVEIPVTAGGATNFYRVRSGSQTSATHCFRGYPADELRVAVVADTGFVKADWGDAVLRENPHLLLSAGDHVSSLHGAGPAAPGDFSAFLKLVDRWPTLFRSTPWMPVLGNHDREIRPRGPKPPPEPVYDIEATAFRDFFALPGDEWHWHFDVPDLGVRFVALDLSHLSDLGTTWQTCHPYASNSTQFAWYRDLMAASLQPFVVTLYNEQNSRVRGLEGGAWGRMIADGTIAITGFGYFAERAEVGDFTYYNTSVSGTGARYADPKSAVLKSEDNFLLLTVRREPRELRAQLKDFAGGTLDDKAFAPRKQAR